MYRSFRALLLVAMLLGSGRGLLAQFLSPAPTTSEGLNIPRPITTDPAILYPSDREMILMSGDLIRVSVFESTDYSDIERISLDGTVRLPLAGVIKLAGLSLQDAQLAIAARLVQLEMFKNPQVSVQVSEAPGHVATVTGEMHGSIPVIGHKRLLDVLSVVGGMSPSASPVITIERPGVTEPIIVDLGSDPVHSSAANVPVFAGDTVLIGNVGGFYVIGAVKTPGLQHLNGFLPTTVLQAVALSGGVQFASKQNETKLIRTVGSQRSLVPLHLKNILNGKEPDPILQADDILFVPPDRVKAFLTSGGFSTIFSLAIAAYAITRY
jgi:polysaccharide export outer membrane protein